MQFYAKGNIQIVAVRSEEAEPEINLRVEFPFMKLENLLNIISAIRWHVFPDEWQQEWQCDDVNGEDVCVDLEELEGGAW